jgi:hypothetical protein
MFSSFPDTRCLPISPSSSTKEAGAGSVYKHLAEPPLRPSSSKILPFSSPKSLRSSLMEFVPALPRHLKTQGHPRKFFSSRNTKVSRGCASLSLSPVQRDEGHGMLSSFSETRCKPFDVLLLFLQHQKKSGSIIYVWPRPSDTPLIQRTEYIVHAHFAAVPLFIEKSQKQRIHASAPSPPFGRMETRMV